MMAHTHKEIRLRHAKRLALQEFAELATGGPQLTVKDLPDALDPEGRQQRSAALVASCRATHLYTPLLEQCRSLAVSLRQATRRIRAVCEQWCHERRSTEAGMIEAVASELRRCFGETFGDGQFCAYVGLLEPKANVVRIVAASRESEVVGCCLCRESSPLIFECVDNNKTLRVETHGLFEGRNPCLCAPLRTASGLPLGILAMDGFCDSALSLRANALRDKGPDNGGFPQDLATRLSPFLRKGDEASKNVRLWRLRDTVHGVMDADVRRSSVGANIIAGRVCDVNRSSRHAIYTVQWEDGRSETDISLRAMKELLTATPATLGVGVPCDDVLLEFADYVGSTLGDHLFRCDGAEAFVESIRAQVPDEVLRGEHRKT